MDSVIRYIKVNGGPEKERAVLVGLKDGMCLKIFINNDFPVELVNHGASVRCLDMSAFRKKLAVVDENSAVVVYDVKTKAVLFEGKGANSVAFNSDLRGHVLLRGRWNPVHQDGGLPRSHAEPRRFCRGFQRI